MAAKKIPIIAFGHQSRVGKDTAAAAVAAQLHPTLWLSFADMFKDMAYRLWHHHGLEEAEYYEDPDNEELRDRPLEGLGKSPVQLWIELGKRVRSIHQATWVDCALRDQQGDRLVVISDLRFQNEALAIRESGGWCVKIERPGAPPPKGSDNEILPSFAWDRVIVNDGSKRDLRVAAVRAAVDYIDVFSANVPPGFSASIHPLGIDMAKAIFGPMSPLPLRGEE